MKVTVFRAFYACIISASLLLAFFGEGHGEIAASSAWRTVLGTTSTARVLSSETSPLLMPDTIDKSRSDSVEHLRSVVVTAERRRESVIPPQAIKGEELQRLNSLSIADAMRYFSGVQIKDYGGVGGVKTINIRSMGSQHVGIFYDGVELGNAQNGQIDLGQYSLANMEAIELYNGQKSGILQPAKDFGSSGTIYLRTRKPSFSPEKSDNLCTSVKFGSFGLINPSLIWEKRLGRFSSFSLSSEYTFATGKYKFRYRKVNPSTGAVAYDTTAIRQNGDINAFRLEGTLFGGTGDSKYTVKSYNYLSYRGIPGAIVNNVWRRGERMNDLNNFLQGLYEVKLTDFWHLKAIAKYAYYYTHFRSEDPTTILIDNNFKQHEAYFSVAQSLELTRGWHLSLAYDYLFNLLDSNIRDFVWPRRHTHLLALSSAYNLPWLELQASLLGTFIRDYAKQLTNTPNYRKLSPAVVASFKPFSKLNLHFNLFYKQSFRMPTFNDLYYTDVGNSKLSPEKARQYNLTIGYSHTWTKGSFREIESSLSIYHNRVKDKIIAYPKGQQFRWTMLNLGKVSITGAEASLSLLNNWGEVGSRLHLQYTFQKAIDTTDPKSSYYRHQIPYIPRHSGSASLGVFYKSWQFNFSFIYAGERYSQRENIVYYHMQPWYTNDLSIAYDLELSRGQSLRIQIECNNLLNQQYDVIKNYPMPGRNWRITTQWKI